MSNRLALDPKDFTHVSSDDKQTILKNKAGHTFTIVHSALSKKNQEILGALANAAKPKEDKVEETKPETVPNEEPKKYALGEMVTDSGMPTEVDVKAPEPLKPEETQQPMAQLDPDLVRKREIYNRVAPTMQGEDPRNTPQSMMFGPNGEAPVRFNPQAWAQSEQSFAREKETNAANAVATQQQVIALNQQRVAAGLDPIPVPNVPTGPQPPGAPPVELPQVQPASAGPQPENPMAMTENMMREGLEGQVQGIQAGAKAQGELGAQQAKALEDSATYRRNAQVAYQKQYDALERERQMHMKDIQDAHINPEQYWTGDKNGNGSHSKLMSSIGIILAGFNPTNRPNAAVELLKYQMDQNLNAQKENLGKEKSLLDANLRQFGNLRDATDMTRLMQSDVVQNELALAAAKSQSPIAQAQAQQAIGQLKTQAAPLFQQFAMRRAMMGLAGQNDTGATEQMLNYMDQVNPEAAKGYRERFDRQFGLAVRPLNQGDREKLDSFRQTDIAVKDMQDFVKHNTTLVPGTPAYNAGALKALELQQIIRKSAFGGIYREGEQPLLDKFLNSNPAGAFKQLQTNPQLRELLNANVRQFGTFAEQLFPSAKSKVQATQNQQSPQAALQWAKANPADPRAKEILKRLGQ